MKIVVVGGGTAGWLTALTARMTFPDHDITVLESEEIGIIGAGEGTTPQIVPLLDSLGIPFSDLVRFCDATIKQSIKFTNWQGSGDSYHHAFITNKDLQFVKEPNELLTMRQTPSVDAHIYASMLGDPQDAYNLAASLSLQNKIPFVEGRRNLSECSNPIHLYDGLAAFAIHFNATKLAGYLRQVAAARDIKQTDGIVGRIITDDYGSITTIVSDKGETIEGDFFFDCTGFHRVLIGKFYGSKWISYKDILPADKAIGYFKPMDHDIPSYTEAIAMNNGWSWQIPLTARYGAGYVYSSAFTNLNDVEKEIVEMEGENIEWGREFSFEAGCYEKI
jgi:flavin-dependent dehydrogenase